MSHAATQVMASHQKGVVRLVKPWFAKVEIPMNEPRPAQWLQLEDEAAEAAEAADAVEQLALEDGPTLFGWMVYEDGTEEY